MTREEAERELCRLLEEAEADIQAGRTIPAEEVFAQLREKFAPRNIVYLTGDTHGRFERIVDFCSRREMEPENTFVILGDAGLNFYGGRRDALGKEQLAKLPCTFFCIHGNHEQRPGPELGYELSSYHGGQVWVQPQYHTEKQVDKLRFMFEDYALLPHTLSIEEEKALIAKMERQAEMMEALGWDEEDI